MQSLRRVFMWLTVISLGLITVCAAASWVINLMPSAGRTFYAPYSVQRPLSAQIELLCEEIMVGASPVATGSAAVYILLIEKAVRKAIAAGPSRGFEVLPSKL